MTDRDFLMRSLELAAQSDEPVGCGVVIAMEGNVTAEAYNSQRADAIAINHAEIKAIVIANQHQKSRKLEHSIAYCSCEPCAMCLTALSYARVSRIVFHKAMKELFPNDPQSQLDAFEFVKGLNFIPKLEHIPVL